MNNPFKLFWLMMRARRPSRIVDMTAVKEGFWLRRNYDAMMFFGFILAHTKEEADRINKYGGSLKRHETIHLRQAQACGDSWLRFYLLYIWYWLKGLRMSRRMRHAAYLLNPFEMEAYARMHDLHYLERCEGGAQEWRRYAKMSLEERLACYQRK